MDEPLAAPGRSTRAVELAFALFAAIQTFLYFAEIDRFSVVFWWDSVAWPFILYCWAKDLALAAGAFTLARLLFRISVRKEGEGAIAPASGTHRPLVLAAVIAAGAFLRFVAPERIPGGTWADAPLEIAAVLAAPGGVPWYGGTPHSATLENHALTSNLYMRFCEATFHVFGRGERGILAISALAGVLAIPAVYWLAFELFGAGAALLCAFLIAFLRWPLIFSRWGYIGAMLVVLGTLAGAATLAALQTGRLSCAAISGLAAGLALHTHPAAYGVIFGLGLFSLWSLRRPEQRRTILCAWVFAVIGFLPFAWGYGQHPENFGGRLRDVPIAQAQGRWAAIPWHNAVRDNLREYTGVLLWTTDPQPRHTLRAHSAMSPLIGIAALVGFALAAARALTGSARDVLFLSLTAGGLSAGLLSNSGSAPNLHRICYFMAPAVIAAGGTLYLWMRAIESARGPRRAFTGGAVVLVVLLMETAPFAESWPENRFVAKSFCLAETHAGRLRRRLPAGQTYLETGALPYTSVFDVVAGPSEADLPVPRTEERSASDLVSRPPRAPFYYVARESALSVLRQAGWKCARGVRVHETVGVVLARVVPP